MSEPFVGEIRMFAGNFAPRGWAFCDGQLLAVSQNDALFSLFGTVYGGDGRTTFGLPDLRGRIPLHAGTGPGRSPRRLGSKGGEETVTVTVNQLPSHTHAMTATTGAAVGRDPVGSQQDLAPATAGGDGYARQLQPVAMNAAAVGSAGGRQPHTNLMPFLCVHFIVALFGIYPSRH
jgi:microcystin-dependent protein